MQSMRIHAPQRRHTAKKTSPRLKLNGEKNNVRMEQTYP